jgi:hypothetical protein
MNALDVLKYGNRFLLDSLDGIEDWNSPGITTRWSAKDVLGHLASFERYLEEALLEALGRGPTPVLDAMRADAAGFNDREVGRRTAETLEAVRREYDQAHARVVALVRELGPERMRQPGTIPWYGAEYSLDDLVVYVNYGHKREHGGQVRAYKARLAASHPGRKP